MALTKDEKSQIVKKYARGKADTGSAEVQIAILTKEISELTEHLKTHKQPDRLLHQLEQQSLD